MIRYHHFSTSGRRLEALVLLVCMVSCFCSFVVISGCSNATAARQAKTDILVKTSWNTRTTLPFVQEIIGTVFIFARDGTYQQVDPNGNIVALGKWSFNTDQTSITVELSNSISLMLEIQELTADSFRFRVKLPDSGAIVEFFCSPVR
jgi:hypothetical protein